MSLTSDRALVERGYGEDDPRRPEPLPAELEARTEELETRPSPRQNGERE